MATGRLISIAKDKITGKILDANLLFDQSKKESFEIRKEYNQDELDPICLECEQDLTVAHSKYDRNYFRHLPYHSYCILSDNSLSPKEQNEYVEIARQRESDRHKYLKNKIGNLLGCDSNVSNINIDSRYILTDTTKRKPDVYCEYNGYKIVFEIQLSKLPLWYILKRYNFYKANNIILVWILDNFNVRDQSSFERDIKYLNKYQNFFKLDEDSVDFKLICEYKEVFIENYIVKSKWTEYSVQLSELKIDQEEVQAFYYDYPAIERAKNYELIQLLRQKEEDEFNSEQERKSNERKKKATKIIESINKEKLKVNPYYKKIENDINELSYLEIQELNKQMNLKKATRTIPPIITWIGRTNEENFPFLTFLLECKNLEFNINTATNNEKTPFLAIYLNNNLRQKKYFCKLLFKRGYLLQQKDLDFIKSEVTNSDFTNYKIWNQLKNRNLVDSASEKDSFLFILESAKTGKIRGNKLSNWISFANNAIQFYGNYWDYIELALKKYELWDKIIENDTKGNFQKKLQHLYQNFPEQLYDVDECIRDLYPELVT